MSGMTVFHVVIVLNILENGIKSRSNDAQIPRTDHVERSLDVIGGCRFGSRCHCPPWETEQSRDEPWSLPLKIAVLVVDSNQSLGDILLILGKGEVFKHLVTSLDIEISPPLNLTTKQVRNVQI
jgi:hypothetical protein